MARKKARTRQGFGEIEQLPSGNYRARYTGPDGERYKAQRTFVAKIDAEGWLSVERAAISSGKWKPPVVRDAEVFGPYATSWLAQRTTSKGQPLRPKTRAEYSRQLANGLATFADDHLGDITAARVRAWHNGRAQAGPTQAGAEARLLHAILNTAVADGIIDANPVPSQLGRTSTGVKHRPPTLDELSVILDTIGPNYRLAVILASYAGLRLSEWRALRRKDVKIADGRVTVTVERQAVYIAHEGWQVGPPKSDEGVRTKALPAALAGEFTRHLAEHVGEFPESLLFAPPRGSGFLHDKPFYLAWDRARDAAGVREVVREHDLRHFYGSGLADAGAGIAQIQHELGHGSARASLVYLHAAQELNTALADSLPLPPARPRLVANLNGEKRT
ncbi:tyrosine-type recombinase/integrase [Gryllotalpicola sp.]|uniref:tyrosine-type recombinase/integrase n=1 Tax=Gryllotalpicola sp. TaxID=1932787 RepID=UPI0026387AF3|nr:tyrosine-type recombinase/integrase [Gryllotalpicola sp.]